jgi:acetyl-CoA C-acetyltransferase
MCAQPVPVIVGTGQLLQRVEDIRDAQEPLALMQAALMRAADDAGAARLLHRADAIYVPRGMWRYADAGRELARRLGAPVRQSVSTPYGGNYAQACVLDAAREIAAGRCGVALVCGAENGRSLARAEREGFALEQSEAPGAPDRLLAPDKPVFHDAELARGMNSASDVFAIIDSRLRSERGESLAAHAERVAALWAAFAAVAAGNPSAWIRSAPGAGEIRRATPENPMISSPYTRLMNANMRVDLAAGLVLCSLEIARAAGVPEEKLVYLHAATEADDSVFLSEREELHRSPAVRIAGARALELSGREAAEIDHYDLYSCFPAAVQVTAQELGVPPGRALTVTGGLTFGGGPLNSYGLHAVARMAEVVRADRGSVGLVHGNGGWLAKHSFGVYSCAPPEQGFRCEKLQAEVDALPLRRAEVDWKGAVTLEAYTVAHHKGQPRLAHVACLTDDGRRTWATSADAGVLQAMLREEFCGRRGRIDGRGGLTVD